MADSAKAFAFGSLEVAMRDLRSVIPFERGEKVDEAVDDLDLPIFIFLTKKFLCVFFFDRTRKKQEMNKNNTWAHENFFHMI